MSDLTALRDHARAMADWQPPKRPDVMSLTCYRAKHDDCTRSAAHCCCSCHNAVGPTPKERELWTAIADEIDAYLAPDDDGPGLFGEDA